MKAQREIMVEHLRRNGVSDAAVLQAMASVPREEFVPPRARKLAYADHALSIGHDQTISQPLMVALLVQALQLAPGGKVLDVGTGSGYQTAVIAACGAQVFSIERIAQLAETARERLRRLGYDVAVHLGDGSLGLPEAAPFSAIAVAAAVPQPPPALISQLAEGGRLVLPLQQHPQAQELVRITRRGELLAQENLGACVFVPLIGAEGY